MNIRKVFSISLLSILIFNSYPAQAMTYKQYKANIYGLRVIGALAGLFGGSKVFLENNSVLEEEPAFLIFFLGFTIGTSALSSYLAQKLPQITSSGYYFRAKEIAENKVFEKELKIFEDLIKDKNNFIEAIIKYQPNVKYPLCSYLRLLNDIHSKLNNLYVFIEKAKINEEEILKFKNFADKNIPILLEAISIIRNSEKYVKECNNIKELSDQLNAILLSSTLCGYINQQIIINNYY